MCFLVSQHREPTQLTFKPKNDWLEQRELALAVPKAFKFGSDDLR